MDKGAKERILQMLELDTKRFFASFRRHKGYRIEARVTESNV